MSRARAVPLLIALLAGGAWAGSAPARPLSRDRLEAVSRTYLGVRYRLDPLGEGRGPDRDPLFDRKAVDCQTLVEQVLAESLAPRPADRDRVLLRLRYRDAAPTLEQRLHFCIPDWLENPWPVRDVTATLGPTRFASRRLDLPGLLRARGGDPRRSPHPARRVSYRHLPRAAVGGVPPARLDGTIAVWVVDRSGTIAGHLGFLFRSGGGERIVFRHASQRRGRVVDEPLSAYLARAPRSVVGLIVLAPLAAFRAAPL